MKTPYYLIDEQKLLKNMQIIEDVRLKCGAKSLLALKCFSAPCVFPLMREYMSGTTSSSLFEARLGSELFGKETHAYCVGYTEEEFSAAAEFADKIIFNSAGQLDRYLPLAGGALVGLRVNPGISHSDFDLADPARQYSRLGVTDINEIHERIDALSGLMFHYNCENSSIEAIETQLDIIAARYGKLLKEMQWTSLGGGMLFTAEGFPLDRFCSKLAEFSDKFGIQIYLEPGEAAVTGSAELITTVTDIVHNEMDIAVVDASVEAHMLDLMTYNEFAKAAGTACGTHPYIVAGKSCLAGDIFGTFKFEKRLKIGDEIRFADAAGYTMVKKNWFNGLMMPSIAVRRIDGTIELIREFVYSDFLHSLS